MKRCFMTMVAVMTLTMAGAQTVMPQACEQSIVTPKANGRYLWLPIQESAPEGKVQVIVTRTGGLLCGVGLAAISGQGRTEGMCAECADGQYVLQEISAE